MTAEAAPFAAAAAPRFILLNPSHPGNVGAAARAMKVMGCSDLVLVAPRHADVLQRPDAVAFASAAADVLARARVVERFVDALDGVDHLCATAMTRRDFGPPTFTPRESFAALARLPRRRVAVVFGGERHGMANEDVYRCHEVLRIPTHGGDASLNLAQAVQLIAYEWRTAADAVVAATTPAPPQHCAPAADALQVQRVLADWADMLHGIGFFDPAVPRKLLPRLNAMLNRARPSDAEVHILLGISRTMRLHSAASTSSAVSPIDSQQ